MKLKTAWMLWIAASVVILIAIIMSALIHFKSNSYYSQLNDKITERMRNNMSENGWYNATEQKDISKFGWIITPLLSIILLVLGHVSIIRYAKTGAGKINVVFLVLMILSIIAFVLVGLLPVVLNKQLASDNKITVSSDDASWVHLDKLDANYQQAVDNIHQLRMPLQSLRDTLKTVAVISLIASGAKAALTVGTYVVVRQVSQK